MGAAGTGACASGADRDGLGLVRMAVDIELIVDRNAAVAYAELLGDGLAVRWAGSDVVGSATGSAKREPGEVFDADVARGLAVGRALMELGAVLVSQAELKVEAQNNSRMVEALRKMEQREARREQARTSQAMAQVRKHMEQYVEDDD